METKRAIDFEYMDNNIRPGNDFFRYVNGEWLKNATVPNDKSKYSVFDELDDKNDDDLYYLINEIAANKNTPKGSDEQKIRDLFNTGMDTEKIEADGLTHLKPLLDKVDKITNTSQLIDCIIELQSKGINALFNFYAHADRINSDITILYFFQGGLGLPERDYYLLDDKHFADIRQEYKQHIEKMFALINTQPDTAKSAAEKIIGLETELAKSSMKRIELRDPQKTYHKSDIKKLVELSPVFEWKKFFKKLNINPKHYFNIAQPAFFSAVSDLCKRQDTEAWINYLKWNIVSQLSPYLTKDIEQEHHRFYGGVLSGKTEMEERWKRVLGTVNFALGEAVGQKYVAKHFPPEAKEQMLVLVQNLKKAMEIRIGRLDWMTPQTKQKALDKLATMNFKIGYPDKWKDYSDLEIKTDSYLLNYLRAAEFHTKYEISKINKPVNKDEWHMYPQMVNAYYSASQNEMAFPAGILQPPFFDKDAIDAVNYGAIGMVIGHEMTHGFDDQGRKFDKNGNLNDWWTKTDEKQFDEKTKLLIEQFNRYEVLKDTFIDGELTLGENMADIGGANISLEAFQLAHPDYEKLPPINGFSHIQLFFMSYALVWRNVIREKELKRRIKEDVHSPAEYRVNGSLVNIDEFYEAFDIGKDAKMYIAPDKRASIW